MKDAHVKKTRLIIPDDRFNAAEPIFSQNAFDKAIESKGYEVFVEKAVMCPCSIKGTGAGNPLCQNCGGTRWFFVEKRKTLAVVQSMNRRTKYLNWSETDRGTISITFKGNDRVSFMDRVRVLEVESIFSQNTLVKRSSDNKLFSFLFYAPTEVELCYVFVGNSQKLVPLYVGVNFTIEEDRLLFNNSIEEYLNDEDEVNVTVRYKHNPTYHILDINREIVKTFSTDDRFDEDKEIPIDVENENKKQPMPVNSVARKVHFMFDSPNLSGESLFDNTIIPTNG